MAATKAPRYDLILNVPVVADVRFVDVYPDNGYGAQVALKLVIGGQTHTAYLKGKAWANLAALQKGGVIGAYDKTVEEPLEKVNVPVVNGQGVTLTMQKLPGQKYADLVVTQPGPYASPTLPQHPPKGAPVPVEQPRDIGNLPDWVIDQEAAEQGAVAAIQQGVQHGAKAAPQDQAVQHFFDLHAACVEEVLDVEVPMLKAAGVAVTAEAVSALAAQLFIALTNKVPGVVAQRRAA